MRVRALTFAVTLAVVALPLSGCNRNTAIGNDREAQMDHAPMPAPVMTPQAALRNIATELIKPETMSEADIAALGGLVGRCVIRLTEVAFPSFVYEPGVAGTIKVNGKLVTLPSTGVNRFAQGGLGVTLQPLEEEGDAGLQGMNMILMPPEAKEEVGYSGFVQCYEGDRQ
jgi:hypothetical protein